MKEPKRPTYLRSKRRAKIASDTWAPTPQARKRIHRAYKKRWHNRIRDFTNTNIPHDPEDA